MTSARAGLDDGREAPIARAAFDRIARERRAEIKLHCYRIMGALADAEDMTQETFARAWRARAELTSPSAARAWLYRIATNACLDGLRRRKRERRMWREPSPMPTGDMLELGAPDPEASWLEPMPDAFLSGVADDGPQAAYEQAEAVRLAFLACVQLLPARQRAIFLLSEVLGWSAAETAAAFAITPQAANSLLQRARRTFAAAYQGEPRWAAASDADQQVAERYARALERRDLAAFEILLRADVTMHMPPWRAWLTGRQAFLRFMGQALQRFAAYRAQVFRANGGWAAVAYARDSAAEPWRPHSLQVLEMVGGEIVSVVAFVGPLAPPLFAETGLPMDPAALR